MITRLQLEQSIKALGLAGQCVCVHSSLRSFGEALEDGADGLIDAFLKNGCTLLAPAFCYDHATTPPAGTAIPQNGMDYAQPVPASEKVFSLDSVDMTVQDLGNFPYALLKRPGHVRGNHKLNSFVALGPKAELLVGGQTDERVFAPFEELCRQGGFVLLVGTGLQGCTLLHYSEFLAGRRPFVRWANDEQKRPVPVRIGSCSLGFDAFEPTVGPLQATAQVGGSLWRCFRAQALAEACADAIRQNPAVTHCGNPACLRCNHAVLGGPLL